MPIAPALAGAAPIGRTRRRSFPTSGPSEPCSATPSVTRDLLDRLALDEVLAPYPRNRLHDQHSQAPASFQARQRNRPTDRGVPTLDADPPA
jgi:hypothetical protein